MHQCKNPLDKSNLMRVKAFLQQKLGDQAGAEVSNKEVEKYFQEARRKNKDNNNQ